MHMYTYIQFRYKIDLFVYAIRRVRSNNEWKCDRDMPKLCNFETTIITKEERRPIERLWFKSPDEKGRKKPFECSREIPFNYIKREREFTPNRSAMTLLPSHKCRAPLIIKFKSNPRMRTRRLFKRYVRRASPRPFTPYQMPITSLVGFAVPSCPW